MEIAIIAHSGRALAASAARAQIPVHVIDCFADQDTAIHARSVQQVPPFGYGLARQELEQAITRLCARCDDLLLVPGSGFEADSTMLIRLAALAPCVGNTAATVRQCAVPEAFSTVLAELSIPHPPTSRDIQAIAAPRLIKTVGAMGGGHIQRWTETSRYAPDRQYLQGVIPGKAMSVVFIADGKQHVILGFNELFTAGLKDAQPFLFTGAVTLPAPAPSLCRRLRTWLDRLVPALSLVGLCGADFILNENDSALLLEINPRPPATFELHETQPSLFAFHLHTCRGGALPQPPPVTAEYNAMRVLYARHSLQFTEPIAWPAWTANQPAQPACFCKGEPICTLFATAENSVQAIHVLQQREKIMQRRLVRFRLAA